MWRQGSGREAQRSTGARKHAHVDARVGKDKKIATAAAPDKVPTTHRQQRLEENMARRAEMREHLRLEAAGGADPDGRGRLMLIADRRREERANAAAADAPQAEDDDDDQPVNVGTQIARARRAAKEKKKEELASQKATSSNTKVLVGVAVLLFVVASFFVS